ncbi:MAG: AIR synthase family protein [Chloroflexi bacterium]|nr:AIR synthase family protein [Chloroflexota bacterium]
MGKLPAELLAKLLAKAPPRGERVLLGPGIGLDCAVIEHGDTLLVYKSDPITFASEDIGWYAVQVNANDLATTGARPLWMLATALLPEGKATAEMAEAIFDQLLAACAPLGIELIGGHTEITYGLERPILCVTMIGETTRQALVTPQGAQPGDRLLLTKGVPVEGTALLAREFQERLMGSLSAEEIEEAANMLYEPGIGVTRDARLALAAGRVNAMHDPTEGGLAGALWELAQASGRRLVFEPRQEIVLPLGRRICAALAIDPLATIASGALLLSAATGEAERIRAALQAAGIACFDIGEVQAGSAEVRRQHAAGEVLPRPERDEAARLFG